MKTLSIITTIYNVEKYIAIAINSVNEQKFSGFKIEYVVVNDQTTDYSMSVINEYFKQHKKNPNIEFKILDTPENLGCGGARLFGIKHATGDYFMFLDADDYYIYNDFCQRAMNEIQNEDADIVEYGMKCNMANGEVHNLVSPKRIVVSNQDSNMLLLFKDNLIKFNVWTKIIRRSVVESFEYSTVREFEDVRTIPMWVHNAKKIVIMPSMEINYRGVKKSIMRNDNVNTRIGTISAIASLFPVFKNNRSILKAMYFRSLIDLNAILKNRSSDDEGFNEMSKLNTYMLSFIFPDKYKEFTFNI